MKITAVDAPPAVDPSLVDLSDPEFYAHGDPHPVWAVLRDRDPVHRRRLPDGREFLSVTRYADVSTVLRDHPRFSSRRGTMLSILGDRDPAGDRMMAASDPPVHTAMRGPMAKVLSFAELRSRHPEIRKVARKLLAPLAQGEPWDLAEAAAGFPMAFTGTLMGLPESDWAELTRLTTTAIAPSDPDFSAGAGRRTLVAAHHELFEYFAEQAESRASRDDLVGFLRQMPVGDRTMRLDEVIYNCYSLLLGANVTTPHAMAATVLAFIENPEQYARIGTQASVADAVEEGLRWSSPANHFMRYTTENTILSGVEIEAGAAVVAWLGSANRDERVFGDPFRFDVARRPNRHLAFGFGPHYCIGAPLARIALRLFFGEVVETVERFEPAGPVEHLASNFVAGIKRMPVTARLRAGAASSLSAGAARPVHHGR